MNTIRGPIDEAEAQQRALEQAVPRVQSDMFSKYGKGDADTSLHTAFAIALGIPLKRKPVEMRKPQDIPRVVPNRAERRHILRQLKRAARGTK